MLDLKRVLLADDDQDLRSLTKMALEIVGGLEVKDCGSAEEAFEALTTFKPHLMLLDVMMPGTDGPSILKKMRLNSQYSKIPVIFLTGITRAEDLSAIQNLDVLDVIAKPFDPLELYHRVCMAWKRHQEKIKAWDSSEAEGQIKDRVF